MKLQNSHILITGANRGIGLAVTKMCAQEHANLHLVVRKADANLVEQLLNLGALSVKLWITDLAVQTEVENLISELKDQQIDILFNNAGQLTGGLLENQNIKDIYNMLQVNLLSLIQLTHGLLPQMLKRNQGKIINNASVSAIMHFPCASTYAASKAAIFAFTQCLNLELRDTGLTTLCLITPGIKTRMFDEIEEKYGTHLETSLNSISPDLYAQKIKAAILSDQEELIPSGYEGAALRLTQWFPQLFKSIVQKKFKRHNIKNYDSGA